MNNPRRKRKKNNRIPQSRKAVRSWTDKDITARREKEAIDRLHMLRPRIVGRGRQVCKQTIYGSQFYRAISDDYRPDDTGVEYICTSPNL